MSNQKDIVREGYDKLSFAYREDNPDKTDESYKEYKGWIDELSAQLEEGSSILDIGCGCGVPATKMLSARFDVIGVDFSEVQISRAKKLVPDARFVCGDISDQSFPSNSFAAIVSFFAIIHMPLEEHSELFSKIAAWLQPSGFFLATVGHDEWSGIDESYLGVPGGRMYWSHADEATNVKWIQEAGLRVHWTTFVPEGNSGHALVFAQKPPIEKHQPVAAADANIPRR